MKTKFTAIIFAALLLLPFGEAKAAAYNTFQQFGITDNHTTTVQTPIGPQKVADPQANFNAFKTAKTYTGTSQDSYSSLSVTLGGIVQSTKNASGSYACDGAGCTTNPYTFTYAYSKPTGLANTDHYLAVLGNTANGMTDTDTSLVGKATMTMKSGVKSVSFLWGSVEGDNYVEVSNGKNTTYKISGSDILNNIVNASLYTFSSVGNGTYLFTLKDLSGIASIVFGTCADTFEIAQFKANSVPLPGALVLFGSGLLGLGALKRRGLSA